MIKPLPQATFETARPEWAVKLYYLDLFDSITEAYQAYDEYFQVQSVRNPGLRARWMAALRQLAITLWAKINKPKEKSEELWPNLTKSSTGADLTDEEAFQAMKEIATLFEVNGYTKIEEEHPSPGNIAVAGR